MDDKQILNLLNGFSASGIAELDYEESGVKLVLKRFPSERGFGPPPPASGHLPPLAVQHDASAHPAQAQVSRGAEAQKVQASAPAGEIVASPLVATFYRSPGPDSPPFAEVGKKVKAGSPLCILEAMKNMNELQADFDCEILRVLPENGSLVEFGQPLFEVRRV